MERVLIVDDDRELCELVAELLGTEGFGVEVADGSADGLERALTGSHSLVVLDVMMPGMNGFELLRRLRAEGASVPVLMLTARGEDVDRIVGLEIGADDYLPKPFNPRELVARIHAILRRVERRTAGVGASQESRAPERIEVGDVEVDAGTRIVRRAGEVVELTNVEYEILVMLLSSAGRVVGLRPEHRHAHQPPAQEARPPRRRGRAHQDCARRRLHLRASDGVGQVRGRGSADAGGLKFGVSVCAVSS